MGQVVSQRELILYRGEWKRNGKGVVCVCGVFDLLHPGHIRLLEQARSLADILVVAVQSDAAVRALRDSTGQPQKPLRPIVPAAERMETLAALAAVDYVAEYGAASPADFLAQLQPDVVVEGGGEGGSARPGTRSEKVPGMQIVRVPLEPGYSTSILTERIAALRA